MTSDPRSTPATRARALLAGDPVAVGLGVEVLEVSPGRALVRMTVRADMVQGLGICHGGILFTLCDVAFAAACNSHDEGATVGSGADIVWVSPAYRDDVLVARAHEHTRYGRHGITDVTVRRETDGAVVARFRGRSVVLASRAGAEQERQEW